MRRSPFENPGPPSTRRKWLSARHASPGFSTFVHRSIVAPVSSRVPRHGWRVCRQARRAFPGPGRPVDIGEHTASRTMTPVRRYLRCSRRLINIERRVREDGSDRSHHSRNAIASRIMPPNAFQRIGGQRSRSSRSTPAIDAVAATRTGHHRASTASAHGPCARHRRAPRRRRYHFPRCNAIWAEKNRAALVPSSGRPATDSRATYRRHRTRRKCLRREGLGEMPRMAISASRSAYHRGIVTLTITSTPVRQ